MVVFYNILIALRVAAPANGAGPQGVVQQLSRVLAVAAAGDGDGEVLEQVLLGRQVDRVGGPAGALQAGALRVVADQHERHLGSLGAGYGRVRIKAGHRLTVDDAIGIAVSDVALCPVAGVLNIGERGLVALVLGDGSVTAVADGVDHLRHFRTGYGLIGLERAIFIAVDHAQSSEHIHGLSGFDIRLIRECRTGKHGERAGERQHQCENLFLMAWVGTKRTDIDWKPGKKCKIQNNSA